MGKIHRKIVAAGVCCLMTGMLTGCGNDTTKITEGMQLVEILDYQGALTAFDEAEAQKEDSRLIARAHLRSDSFSTRASASSCCNAC